MKAAGETQAYADEAQKHTGISMKADRHTGSNTPTTLPLLQQRTRPLLWLDPYTHAHSSLHYKEWRGDDDEEEGVSCSRPHTHITPTF